MVAMIRLLIDLACIPVILFAWTYGGWGTVASAVAALAFAYNGKLYRILSDFLNAPMRK